MTTVDPILQCEACGAKMRLKAASLKVLKQVRCGKCQAMLEIPPSLKDGSPVSDAPVPCKATSSTTPAPAAAPSVARPAAPSVVRPAAAPAPVLAPALAPAPAAVRLTPASVVSAPAPVIRPAAAPAPVYAPPVPPPAPAPVFVPSPVAASAPVDPQWQARLDALELTVRSQQETIERLTLQLEQVMQVQTEVATAWRSALGR